VPHPFARNKFVSEIRKRVDPIGFAEPGSSFTYDGEEQFLAAAGIQFEEFRLRLLETEGANYLP
jgi:hypothetical protein